LSIITVTYDGKTIGVSPADDSGSRELAEHVSGVLSHAGVVPDVQGSTVAHTDDNGALAVYGNAFGDCLVKVLEAGEAAVKAGDRVSRTVTWKSAA
jgi:hypothetical protein